MTAAADGYAMASGQLGVVCVHISCGLGNAMGMLYNAYIEGTPIRALCGKVWVPTRDPSRYPVCPTCQEIVDTLFGGGDGDDEG